MATNPQNENGEENSASFKPWQECDDWGNKTQQIEDGVWKLFLHNPVGVGGRVADHAGGIVDQREDEVKHHTANHRYQMEQGL